MNTLKREEIYANEYRELEHLVLSVEAFIERYYNQYRLHSASGYRSLEGFESKSEQRDVWLGLRVKRGTEVVLATAPIKNLESRQLRQFGFALLFERAGSGTDTSCGWLTDN